jgi:hypothetical protein
MRKTVLWGLLAALMVIGLAANSDAAVYTCQVNGVGVENGNLYVILTDDVNVTFTLTKFLLGTVGNATASKYFSTALDAIGSQNNVYANLDLATFAVISDPAIYPYAGLVVITTDFIP